MKRVNPFSLPNWQTMRISGETARYEQASPESALIVKAVNCRWTPVEFIQKVQMKPVMQMID